MNHVIIQKKKALSIAIARNASKHTNEMILVSEEVEFNELLNQAQTVYQIAPHRLSNQLEVVAVFWKGKQLKEIE